jgi:hypothetical protein
LPNLKMKDMIYGQLAFDFDELPEWF